MYLRCNRPRQAKSIIGGGGGGGGGANDYRESELELVIECEQTYTSGRGGGVAFYGCRLAPDFR